VHSSFRPGVGVLCLLFESWSLAALASPSVAKRTADQGLAARWLPVQLVERRAWPDDIYCHRQLVNIAAGCRAALALTSVPL
jgi:hypothetical protein